MNRLAALTITVSLTAHLFLVSIACATNGGDIPLTSIGIKIKILGVLSVVDVRRVRLPPYSLPNIIILMPIPRSWMPGHFSRGQRRIITERFTDI